MSLHYILNTRCVWLLGCTNHSDMLYNHIDSVDLENIPADNLYILE